MEELISSGDAGAELGNRVKIAEAESARLLSELNSVKQELVAAKAEIEKFGQSLVTDILDFGVGSKSVPETEVLNYDSDEETEERKHFVNEKLFQMVKNAHGLTSESIESETVASNKEQLLRTIESTIEPLLRA